MVSLSWHLGSDIEGTKQGGLLCCLHLIQSEDRLPTSDTSRGIPTRKSGIQEDSLQSFPGGGFLHTTEKVVSKVPSRLWVSSCLQVPAFLPQWWTVICMCKLNNPFLPVALGLSLSMGNKLKQGLTGRNSERGAQRQRNFGLELGLTCLCTLQGNILTKAWEEGLQGGWL